MTDSSRVRVSIVGVVVAALFVSLFARLWFLQVNESTTIVASIDQQTLRTVQTEATRGVIYDRAGRALVTNAVRWVVSADPKLRQLPKNDRTRVAVLGRLSELLGVPMKTLEKRLDDPRRAPIETAILASFGVNDKNSAIVRTRLAEHADDFPYVSIDASSQRTYPYHSLAAQLLGYVGQVNADDLARHPDYGRNDEIGKAGIEAVYEDALRGVPASETVLTNPAGQVVGDPVRSTPGQPGRDIRLTIDASIQSEAQQALAQGIAAARQQPWDDLVHAGIGNYNFRAPAGAAVVMDAQSGNVLALASNPDYDPNVSVDGFSADEWAALNNPAGHYPMVDRATSGLYAPGSTFKLVSSFAAVDAGVRNLYTPVDDGGCYTSTNSTDKRQICNASHAVNGPVDLSRALTVSSDVYFYGVGDLLWGAWKGGDTARGDAIQHWARSFGFGTKTGIAVDESTGVIPDAKWRADFVRMQQKRGIEPYKSHAADYLQWNPGDNMNTAVGQGDVLVTPLQLADAYAAFANGGTLFAPRVADAELQNGKVVNRFPHQVRGHINMAPDVRQQMLQGFDGVVHDPHGTAYQAFQGFPAGVTMMGKTGTAQVGVGVPACVPVNRADISGCKADTAWFVGMFGGTDPAHPKYIVVVMVEEAGRGGRVAAPIARQIVESMLNITPRTPFAIIPTTAD
jgi:penicillin-binding protein 2